MKFDASDFERSTKAYLSAVGEKVIAEVIAAGYGVVAHAQTKTPVDTGALRAAWGESVVIKRTATGIKMRIENKTKYARAVEYGLPQRTISVKNKQVLANKKTGQIFGKSVTQKARPAHPMLRPAVAAVIPKLKAKLKGLKP